MAECVKCVYNPVCQLWRESECQDAEIYLTGGLDDCPIYKSAADEVEVVRCEKCKHYLEPYCTRGVKERYGLVYVERTGFCSRGERSENVEL